MNKGKADFQFSGVSAPLTAMIQPRGAFYVPQASAGEKVGGIVPVSAGRLSIFLKTAVYCTAKFPIVQVQRLWYTEFR